jgi:DNA-binding NarL/FixJ family response regulator
MDALLQTDYSPHRLAGVQFMTEERPRTSKALIVDDHPIIRDSLSAGLISLHIFDVVDKESSLAAASLRLAQAADYDLVMLDLHLTDAHGVEAMLSLRESFPGVPVIIFSADESSATITAAFEHGVQGYIPKSAPMTVVINAIRVVLSGGTYIPPQAVRSLGFEPRGVSNGAGHEVNVLPSLSPRQREVMHYLLQGLPNKLIGRRLTMADGTVKSHLNSIYRMFAVNSRAQLILKARELGLI